MKGPVRKLSGLVLLFSASLPASDAVIRIEFQQRAQLAPFTAEFGHALINEERGLAIVEADASLQSRLRAAGLKVEVDIAATAARSRSLLADPERSINGFGCYRTVAETRAWAQQLQLDYPDLVELVDIGDSWEKTNGDSGEDLLVLKLGKRLAPSGPKMLLMTGLHAREFAPVELASRFAEWLLEGYGRDPDPTWMLDQQQFHLLLQANPDGRKRAESQSGGNGDSAQRKNMNRGFCGSGRLGVDLNRNFPFEWGAHNGSSPNACQDTFRGPLAASEPETATVANYLRQVFPDRRGPGLTDPADPDTQGMMFDVHAYGGLVLYPWGFVNSPAPNGTALATLGRRLAWFNGYDPQAAVDLYVTDGGSIDTAYGELGLPSVVFELGSSFFQNCGSFENTVSPDNLEALQYSARILRAPYRWPAGPSLSQVRIEPDLALSGETIRIELSADDRGFSTAGGGLEPVQAITAVRAWPGLAPWQSGSSAVMGVAIDGAFDSSVEQARIELPAGGNSGRRLIYLQAQDASGALGAPTAVFATSYPAAEVASLHGRVSTRSNNAPIAGAEIRAGSLVSSSEADGEYQRRLPAGSHVLEFSAPGFEAQTVPAFTVAGGTSPLLDVQLYALCRVVENNAESGAAGWTTQVLSGSLSWGIQNGTGMNGSAAWTESPSGNYSNNLNTALLSPAFDLVGQTSPELLFDSYCDSEANFDYGIVEVRASASAPWTEVFRCDGDPNWRAVSVPVPSLADASAAQLRFRFTSDGGAVDDGWRVDNIVLRTGGESCRASQDQTVFKDGFEP